jgi:hypothetical protein
MGLKQTGWEGVVLINLTQQKEKWQAVVHMVMNLEVRHPCCVGSITKNFCVLHVQSNTTIFYLLVEQEANV